MQPQLAHSYVHRTSLEGYTRNNMEEELDGKGIELGRRLFTNYFGIGNTFIVCVDSSKFKISKL